MRSKSLDVQAIKNNKNNLLSACAAKASMSLVLHGWPYSCMSEPILCTTSVP